MAEKNKLTDIVSMHDKGVTKTSGAAGILSRLFRQMLWDLSIGPMKLGTLLHNYIMDPRNGVPNNRKDQISVRGNLTKELARPQMTWKIFCKALRFIGIVKFELAIKAYHANGDVTIHSTNVSFGAIAKPKEFDNTLNQPEKNEAVIPHALLDEANADMDNTDNEKEA